jgi:type II secretory pathway component GspD/PulD (secretin)
MEYGDLSPLSTCLRHHGLPRGARLGVLLLCAWALATGAAWAQRYGGAGGGSSRGGMSSRSSANYPSSTAMGGAVVSIDPETRKIMVVTDDDTAQYISQVVSNLNRPAPQVLIKVVFLEVTYRNGSDVGFQGSYTKNLVDNKSVKSTLGQQFGGLPGLTSAAEAGTFSVIGSDFKATLTAIAQAGKFEVLSRPSVLARNNQQAVITVGQQVPLITSVNYDNFGNQRNAISYQSVGIILTVTPFITSAGMVEMIVSPVISSLAGTTVAITTGTTNGTAVGAPIINQRSADTVVVTPDGQMVVIGGLMSNNKTVNEDKIPLLGDIPLLGNLFKRKVVNNEKTELMMFLTPHIIQQSQLAEMAARERATTQLVPQSFSEQELDRFLETTPKASKPQSK